MSIFNRIIGARSQDLRKRLVYSARAFKLIWASARGWTLLWAALLVVAGVLPALSVYLTKLVVDAFAVSLGQGVGWETVKVVAFPAAAMGGVLLLQRLVGSLLEWVRVGQSEHVTDYLKNVLHERAAAADFSFYESAAYHDLLEQANSQASMRVLGLLRDAGSSAQAVIGILSLGFVLLQYGWVIPAILIAGALPAFLVLLNYNKIQHAWWKDSTHKRRLAWYYDTMLTSANAAAEVRMNMLSRVIRASYQGIRSTLRSERLAILRRELTGRFIATLFALLATATALLWVAWRALQGEATIGDLALFYTAFNQGQTLLGSVLSGFGQLYMNTLFLEHVFTFIDHSNEIVDPEQPRRFPSDLSSGVVFEDVTFTYPETSKPALERFTLHIPAGKMVAIVGENGAGKSTLIKLICRFYDPEKGRVLIDGVDIREYALDDLRRKISVMFQFPMKYQMSARENIALGDLPPDALDLVAGSTMNDVREAAQEAGAAEFIERLPQQYDALLGRWFEGGTELSGGEWQRVALARAFLRRAPITILDEPTSFMDSWSENEWIMRFKRMVEGRTSLLITHRFSTAMQADIIHVLDHGKIVETGTHAELLQLGGKYATSWSTQMERANKGMAAVPNS